MVPVGAGWRARGGVWSAGAPCAPERSLGARQPTRRWRRVAAKAHVGRTRGRAGSTHTGGIAWRMRLRGREDGVRGVIRWQWDKGLNRHGGGGWGQPGNAGDGEERRLESLHILVNRRIGRRCTVHLIYSYAVMMDDLSSRGNKVL